MSDTLIVIFVPGQTGIFSRFVSLAPAAFRQTHFFKALRIFIETPHCTQVLIGLGQPLPLTVMPSSSSLYAFTSVLIKTRQMLAGSDGLKTALFLYRLLKAARWQLSILYNKYAGGTGAIAVS